MTPLVIPSDQRIENVVIDPPSMDGRPLMLRIVLRSGTVLGGRIHGTVDAKATDLLYNSWRKAQEPTPELFQWLRDNCYVEPPRRDVD